METGIGLIIDLLAGIGLTTSLSKSNNPSLDLINHPGELFSKLSGDFDNLLFDDLLGDLSEPVEADLGVGLGGLTSSNKSALLLDSKFKSRLSGEHVGLLRIEGNFCSNSSKTSEFLDNLLDDFLKIGIGFVGVVVVKTDKDGDSGVVGVLLLLLDINCCVSSLGEVVSKLSKVSIEFSEILFIRVGKPLDVGVVGDC